MELVFPEGIDSTMLATFDSCPQKFLYEFVLRKVPIGRSVHLHAGGAFAAGVEAYRQSFYREFYQKPSSNIEAMKGRALIAAFRRFTTFWGDYDPPEREYKDFTNMWGALVAYFQEYPRSPTSSSPIERATGCRPRNFVSRCRWQSHTP